MLPRRLTALVTTFSLALLPAAAAKPAPPPPTDAALVQLAAPVAVDRGYERTVRKVSGMVNDDRAATIADAFGLQLLDVLWEDTGRWEGSSVGPNISDVTIEVEGARTGKGARTYLMPVMRHANFSDKTADVPMDKILIPIGNHRGGPLHLVSLTELLASPAQFMSANAGTIKTGSLLAKRDSHALVSAQHAFLPVPKAGKATFWPVIFNYQSSTKNPAVLTILVTRQGTSMTIIDNARDTVRGGGSWGQRLYFNQGGKKAPLIAERLADVKASGTTANGEDAQDLGDDSNVLMLIQVPLRYRAPRRIATGSTKSAPNSAPQSSAMPMMMSKGGAGIGSGRAERSDVDVAVLGHGQTEGPFTELDGLTIARDARFPVRVTLQFYQATSNGVVSHANVKQMAAQIRKVYGKGDFVGSLVVPTGVDRLRPTSWTGSSTAAATASWRAFPGLVERFGRGLLLRPRLSP